MKAEYIYDFMLHQTYSKLSGFLINIAGLSLIIISGLRLRSSSLTLGQALILVIIGLCILAYTPLFLYFRVKQAEKENTFTKNIRCSFDKNGIAFEPLEKIRKLQEAESICCVPAAFTNKETEKMQRSANSASCVYRWQDLSKVISTPKTIAYFISNTQAYIIPKIDFGNQFLPVMKLTFENMSRDKIYIRRFP